MTLPFYSTPGPSQPQCIQKSLRYKPLDLVSGKNSHWSFDSGPSPGTKAAKLLQNKDMWATLTVSPFFAHNPAPPSAITSAGDPRGHCKPTK